MSAKKSLLAFALLITCNSFAQDQLPPISKDQSRYSIKTIYLDGSFKLCDSSNCEYKLKALKFDGIPSYYYSHSKTGDYTHEFPRFEIRFCKKKRTELMDFSFLETGYISGTISRTKLFKKYTYVFINGYPNSASVTNRRGNKPKAFTDFSGLYCTTNPEPICTETYNMLGESYFYTQWYFDDNQSRSLVVQTTDPNKPFPMNYLDQTLNK